MCVCVCVCVCVCMDVTFFYITRILHFKEFAELRHKICCYDSTKQSRVIITTKT